MSEPFSNLSSLFAENRNCLALYDFVFSSHYDIHLNKQILDIGSERKHFYKFGIFANTEENSVRSHKQTYSNISSTVFEVASVSAMITPGRDEQTLLNKVRCRF